MSRHAQAAFFVFVFLTGCASPGSDDAAQPSAGADSAAAADAIKAQARRFSDAYVRGDMETLLGIYTDDGVAAPGGREFIRGRPALDSLWQLPAGRTVLRHASTPVELHVLGDHAYDWGHYEGQIAQNGDTLAPFRGKYVIVWRRGADGTWRMAVDMWNSLPSPADTPR